MDKNQQRSTPPINAGNGRYKPVKSVDKNGHLVTRYHRIDKENVDKRDVTPIHEEVETQVERIDTLFPDVSEETRHYVKIVPKIYDSVVGVDVQEDMFTIQYKGNNNLVVARGEEEDTFVSTLYHKNKEVYTTETNEQDLQRVIDRAGDTFDQQEPRMSMSENAINNIAKGAVFGGVVGKAMSGDDDGESDRRGPIFNFLNKIFKWVPGDL